MLRSNAAGISGFWKAAFGHRLEGQGKVTVGTVWGTVPTAVVSAAADRVETLALALCALHVTSEEDMNSLSRVWQDEPAPSWPGDPGLVGALRKFKPGSDSVIIDETTTAHEIFACLTGESSSRT